MHAKRALPVLAAVLLSAAPVVAAQHSAAITGAKQKPWIVKDGNALKSETDLTINVTQGPFDAWVKIAVAGKKDYLESLGSLPVGTTAKVVHVLELDQDGDNVTFALYDNAGGAGAALSTQTYAQKKIRHWRFYVGHNTHLDIGYTDYQEVLKDKKWPGFWDQALLTDMPGSDAWTDDSKVRLEVEGVYQLDTSLRVRDADWFETLRTRLAQGRFAYGAAFANNAHSNWGAEELARSAYYADRFFRDKTGVPSTKCVIMRDEPTLSWGAIDAMVEAGARTFAIHHNSDHNPWRGTTVYPELFYAQGRNPANRLLVWNSPVENYCVDELGFRDGNLNKLLGAIEKKLMGYQADSRYPYDVAMVNFTNGSDNGPMIPRVYQNIKAINDKGYAFPRIINANYNPFFDDVAATWGASIPAFKGTIEDWWNFGAASTAYETGLNRMNHDKLAAAEFAATLASVAVPGQRYPYEALAGAYENLMLWDEHTWGSPRPAVDEQWRWKRNTAIASDVASTRVLKDSLAALNALIPTTGKTIVVYNNLGWSRSDLVAVRLSDLPAHFDLADGETGAAVRYQKPGDGTAVFVAGNVPGLGYKAFRMTPRADDPVFTGGPTATKTTLENRFFKVIFSEAGHVTRILDKQNGNAEMVDAAAPYPLNQYVIFKEGALAGQVTAADVAATTGPVLGCVTANGATTGLDSLSRKVILYDALPRIDVVNDAVKGHQIANVEMGYFAFPLNVSNVMLRHEMPTGDMRPGVSRDIHDPASEQYYTSSTAFYTVNRWIDASNQRDWGITFASLHAPLVSYGRPDLGCSKKAWDVNYNAPKPWIYSMAFNNEWQTNFQKTQPGRMVFRYALRGHAGGTWQAGNAETFGAEVDSPLKPAVIVDAQAGRGLNAAKGQFIVIDKKNVLLTTAKMAEANGEGLILRFNEIQGRETSFSADLGWFAPAAVTETDLIENDKAPLALAGGKIALTIPAFGFKTVRLTRGAAPGAVGGLAATFDAGGCQVTWTDTPGASCYEVFRGTSGTFSPGSGSHVATVSASHCYDPAVKTGLSRPYWYSVRAAGAGKKSAFAAPVQAKGGTLADTAAPAAPVLSAEALHAGKVTLSWQPSTDDYAVKGYRVYRDETQIVDLPEEFNSWMDAKVAGGRTYTYVVKAYDIAGNLSAASNAVAVATPAGVAAAAAKKGNVAPSAKVTASSEFGEAFAAENLVEGTAGEHENGEWASKGEKNPWIQLTWDGNRTVNKVVLYDRANPTDDATGGTLSFSDGSRIDVTGIPADGAPKEVKLENKTVTWVKFQVTAGKGMNVGLSEIEVFGP